MGRGCTQAGTVSSGKGRAVDGAVLIHTSSCAAALSTASESSRLRPVFHVVPGAKRCGGCAAGGGRLNVSQMTSQFAERAHHLSTASSVYSAPCTRYAKRRPAQAASEEGGEAKCFFC